MILSDGFHWTTETWGRALRSRALGEVADHFFTTSALRLRGERTEDDDWARVASTIGVSAERLVRLDQVHGCDVQVVRRGEVAPGSTTGWRRADIIISDDPDVAVAVQAADCVPILMADPRTGAVAAVHAGWRGTLASAGPSAVRALGREFGVRASDLVVALGPSIGACCYVVGDEVRRAFEDGGFGGSVACWFSRGDEGRLRLDLWTANCDLLRAAGIRGEAIHASRLCTSSHPELFASYRRDGKDTGRIAAVIRASNPS
ncbi:MAG TPA: peptidoglycan editing factor PgeF [Vicinamibacterales bacterium]|jgi:hypothetical protein